MISLIDIITFNITFPEDLGARNPFLGSVWYLGDDNKFQKIFNVFYQKKHVHKFINKENDKIQR